MAPTSSCSCNYRNTVTSRPRQLQKPRLPRCLCVYSLTSVCTTIFYYAFWYVHCSSGWEDTSDTVYFRRLVGDVHSVAHPCRTLRTEEKDYLLRSEPGQLDSSQEAERRLRNIWRHPTFSLAVPGTSSPQDTDRWTNFFLKSICLQNYTNEINLPSIFKLSVSKLSWIELFHMTPPLQLGIVTHDCFKQ